MAQGYVDKMQISDQVSSPVFVLKRPRSFLRPMRAQDRGRLGVTLIFGKA